MTMCVAAFLCHEERGRESFSIATAAAATGAAIDAVSVRVGVSVCLSIFISDFFCIELFCCGRFSTVFHQFGDFLC